MPTLQRIKMYYDPLGRVVRTINPDQSEQRVVYGIPTALNAVTASKDLKSHSVGIEHAPSPWENYTYDANDLAAKTHIGTTIPTSHQYTPKSALVDGLGRTIRTTEHIDKTTLPVDNFVMQYQYDIRGNLLKVIDPLGRIVFEQVYDLRPAEKGEDGKQQPLAPLKTVHLDKGTTRILFDAAGKPIESQDAKTSRTLSSYDKISRPVNSWAKNIAADLFTLRGYNVYGDSAGLTNPHNENLRGKAYESYDEAGKQRFSLYDFKGNLITKTREVIDTAFLKVALGTFTNYIMDWGTPPTLLGRVFTSDMAYDALNRVTKLTLPTDVSTVNGERKKIVPSYNRAGALESVKLFNEAETSSTTYVENIAYNAKGQRLLIAFGNNSATSGDNIMSRYTYDPLTFKLLRQRSEKYTKTTSGNTVTYAYAGDKRQDDGFNYDLVGNILKILDRMDDSGLGSTPNALDRTFKYDALYRLTEAKGRESNAQDPVLHRYQDVPIQSGFTNVRSYTRNYTYDKLGNIKSLVQPETYGFTRDFRYTSGKNTLSEVKDSNDSLIESFTYDANGNQLTAGTTRNYKWNHADQLICYYNQAGGNPTVFTQYDYSGQARVSKLVRTGSTYERTIYIDGIFEYVKLESATIYEKNYIHIMDDKSRIAEVRITGTGGIFPGDITNNEVYILESQIGSSVMRLDSFGDEIDREEYYPFGDSSHRTFAYKRYRYVGKERDAESGLYYYGARYYAPWMCRFISVDPLADKYAHLNGYNYASNNPITYLDIDGLQNPSEGNSEPSKPNPNSVRDNTNTATKQIKIDQAKADQFFQDKANGTLGLKQEGAKLQKMSEHSQQQHAKEHFVPEYKNPDVAAGAEARKQYDAEKNPLVKASILFNTFGAPVLQAAGSGLYIAKGSNNLAGGSPLQTPAGPRIDGRTFINVDKQGPHTPGSTLVPGRSILTENAQNLLDAFNRGEVKSAQPINDYKTRVDFGRTIGTYINRETGISAPTTRGMVIFSKIGSHIVPSAPN